MSDDNTKEQKGKWFERLVAAVQKKLDPGSTVEWDVFRTAKSGVRRQIDVLVRGTRNSAEILVAVEAKDREEKVSINMVGDFYVAATGIGATHGIMVSSLGFSEPALLEAKHLKIDTCVLRPADNEDWEGYIRRVTMRIQPKRRNYLDAEIELADGTKFSVAPSGMWIIETPEGATTFFDRIVEGALVNRRFDEGAMLEFGIPPGYTAADDNPSHVVKLRCRPVYVDGTPVVSMWDRPEDWVLVKCLPGELIDEKHFFEFKELADMARQFKAEKDHQGPGR